MASELEKELRETRQVLFLLYGFVCDCCQSGDLNPETPIAPMSESENRTLGQILDLIESM